MSSKKCIVCLQGSCNQVVHVSLSSPLFVDFPDATLASIGKLNNSKNDVFAFCSHCLIFLVRLTKLNTKFKRFVSKVQQSYCDARARKFRAIHNVGQSTLETDDNTVGSEWQKNHFQHHPGEGSNVTCDPQSEDDNEFHNDCDADETSCDNVTQNIEQDHEFHGLRVEETIQHEAEAAASPSVKVYEDKWLPNNLTFPKSPQLVKRLSERGFIYLDKYPFQGTEFGFKCGFCNVIVMFCTYKSSAPWFNIVKHFRRRHMGIGDHNSRRTGSTQQRCIQVAPNRFQYGKYFIEEVDGRYKCGECGILTRPAKTSRHRMQHIQRHIRDQHEHPSRTYACKECGMVYRSRKSLSLHKINKHQVPSGQFPCSDCGAIFDSSVAAISHRRTFHRKVYRKIFDCKTCGKVFSQKASWGDHVAFVHNGRKLNECQVCGKTFSSRRGLNIHENSHMEQITYKCDVCGMTFNKNYLFTLHKKRICPTALVETGGAGLSVNVYEDNWLPNNLTVPQFSQLVKRKSEREFIYKDKYPFQGTESGFKCGLCSIVVMFCSYEKSPLWQNLIKHMKMHHMGDQNFTTSKHIQRCVEVAPNRFKYGKYFIEKVDGLYKCGECGSLQKPAKPYKMQRILKHIIDQHENSSMTYVCEYCGAVYKKKPSLTVHKITKHGDPNGKFPCSKCNKVFRNRVSAMDHRQRVHQKNPPKSFTCETCERNFSREDLLNDHVVSVHKGLKLHECEECGKKFGTRTGLKNHQNAHPGNRKYIYNVSGTLSVEENQLPSDSVKGHYVDSIDTVEEDSIVSGSVQVEGPSEKVAQSYDEPQVTSKVGDESSVYEDNWLPKSLTIKSSPFVKRLCERDFVYKDEYPFQGTEFGFRCGLCPVVAMFCTNRTSAPWQNLIKHMKRHHMGDPKVQTIRTVQQRCIEVAPNRFQYGKYSFQKVDGMFKCGECGLLKKPAEAHADSHRNMVKHIAERHEKPWRTFACNYCGVVYNNRSSLRNHTITKHESPNGQVPCRDCGKVFANRIAANGHRQQAHRNRNKFICEICGKNFRQKDAMEDHVAFVHNGQSKHECEECGKKFASKAVLNVHKNHHTGRKKYACDICGMNFTQQPSIKRHKKTAHGVG